MTGRSYSEAVAPSISPTVEMLFRSQEDDDMNLFERRSKEMQYLSLHQDELQAYAGQWIVLEGEEIISHHTDAVAAVEEARAKGIKRPFVTRIFSPEDRGAIIA